MTQPIIDDPSNSQSLLNQIVCEYFAEQKRKRRWKWVRRIVLFLLIIAVIGLCVFGRYEDIAARAKPHVGLIDIKGEITDGQVSSADIFMKSLTSAYENKGLKAVILRIDSPGGSPVQADYMYNSIRYFRQKYPNVKTYAVCVDTCASAAYYIAAAADDIYASPSSLVGSIGVVYNGFGFVDTMQKMGVSRRLVTSGRNKGFMDQFSPINPEQEKNLLVMLDLIHEQFINQVKAGRGDRLKVDEDTFSGLIWTGVQAKERGLIDGFASSGQLMRDVIKLEQVVDYTEKHSVLEQVANRFGSAVVNQLPLTFGLTQGLR
ncbi:MAG: S49 family peptidase [Legionellaceae bacterium]|nr:S49 family peptidase [Legionellaceae bacterium]